MGNLMMEAIGFIFVLIVGLIIWALFCVMPAYHLYHDHSEAFGFAYFFLSSLLFSMSMTLSSIHRQIKARNEELYRQANRKPL